MSDLHERFTDVFRSVFDDPTLEVDDSQTADDIEGWDSLTHITLIFTLEEEFGVLFPSDQLNELRDVGGLRSLLESLVA